MDDLEKIKHMVEETMMTANLPGVCEVTRKKTGDIAVTFTFDGGHRSPVSVGGTLSELRTWEHFAKKASVTFLRLVPSGVGDTA